MKYLYIIYQYLVALPIVLLFTIITAVVTIIFSRWKNSAWLHTLQMWWSKSFYYLCFIPVHVSGLENINPNQSYVFVSNHQSMFDVVLVYGWLPVVFKWMMKKELRRIPFVGKACEKAGHIYVDRKNIKAAQQSISDVKAVLKDGVSTVIYPEGTRTKDGSVGRFKRGAFQIALDLGLPIVPISLSGCYEVMPRNKMYVTHHPVYMHVGKPIDVTQFEDRDAAIEYVRQQVIDGMINVDK